MQKNFDYPDSVKAYMKAYYAQLPERSCRQYAAIEAIKLGWGGQTYICNLLLLTAFRRRFVQDFRIIRQLLDWSIGFLNLIAAHYS